MGNYLNRLTARVSGTQKAVRPQLPSLFEPPTGLKSARIASMFAARRERPEEESPAVENTPRTVVTGRSAPQAPPAQEKPALPALPVTFKEHSEKVEPQPAVTQPSMQSRPMVRTRQVIEPVLREEKRESRESESRLQATQHATEFPAWQKEEAAPAPLTHEQKQPAVLRAKTGMTEPSLLLPSSWQRVAEMAREALRLPEERAVENPATPPITALPSPSTHVPAIAPVQPNRQPVIPRIEAREDTAPSVQVVIGRVTVQAIAPPPSPAAPAPRPHVPRLSLEEYLRQREGRA
jgi:hypothetical protein